MLKASLELNRALEKLLQVSDSLGEPSSLTECNFSGDELVQAATKFLKCYELCVRIDESLGDIVRHQGTQETEVAIERARNLINEVADVVKSFKNKERQIFLTYAESEFKISKKHLEGFIIKRPAERIWHEDNIQWVVKDVSNAVKSLRKSAAYAIFMTISPDHGYAGGKLVC